MKKLSNWLYLSVALVLAGGLFDAYAAENSKGRLASTIVSPTSPQKRPDRNGFLKQWLVLEPISVEGRLTDSAVQTTVKKSYFPNQFAVIPAQGDTVTIDNNHYQWYALETTQYNLNLYHFAHALNKPTSNVLFWVVGIVNAPREMTDVRLAVGTNAASIWWLNDEEVISLYNDRQTVIDDGVSKRLTLKKGANVIRAAIINAGGATDFAARFLDENNLPIQNLTNTLVKN